MTKPLSTLVLETVILNNLPFDELPMSYKRYVNNMDAVTAFLDLRSKKLIAHYIDKNRIRKILFNFIDNVVLRSGEAVELLDWLRKHGKIINTDLLNDLNLKVSDTDFLLGWACKKGYLDVLKYFRITLDEFRTDDNFALRMACRKGRYDIVEYLREEIGLTDDDFRADDNYALKMACERGHYKIVEYLGKFLNRNDFRAENNYALRYACKNGHLDIIEYLHNHVHLNANDFRAEDNEALRYANENGHLDIVEYLIEKVGLSQDDV